MKRYAFYMLVMAVAAVAACQKQSVVEVGDVQDTSKGTYIYTLNATIGDAEVKSDYDADGKFSWSENDAISVLFHKDDAPAAEKDKFFTLTRDGGTGANATFSGSVTSGYSIGSSDNGNKVWALYPANANHSYTAGENSSCPVFYTPAVNDLTGSNFSANIPMYAKRDGTGTLEFHYAACAYKFTISDLDATKIQVDVENGVSYSLSGSSKMGSNYVKYSDDVTAAKKKITYICDVTTKTAVFYVSCRYNGASFKPTVTIRDYNTGYTLKTLTATNAKTITNAGEVQKINVSASGAGTTFSAWNIDWANIGGELDGPTGSHGGMSLKGAKDATYIYVLCKIDKSKLLTGWHYSNAMEMYLGKDLNDSGEWKWEPKRTADGVWVGYITRESIPYTDSENYKSYEIGNSYFTEIRYARSNKTYLASGTAYVGILLWNDKYNDGTNDLGAGSTYLFSPATATGYLTIGLD